LRAAGFGAFIGPDIIPISAWKARTQHNACLLVAGVATVPRKPITSIAPNMLRLVWYVVNFVLAFVLFPPILSFMAVALTATVTDETRAGFAALFALILGYVIGLFFIVLRVLTWRKRRKFATPTSFGDFASWLTLVLMLLFVIGCFATGFLLVFPLLMAYGAALFLVMLLIELLDVRRAFRKQAGDGR
jgi:hypothetical protein